MSRHSELKEHSQRPVGDDARERLLVGLPVTERRLDLAGVSTSFLEGGEGPPIVLLHGQGGFAAMWGRVIPHLVESHRVVVPDLLGLGHSEVRTGTLDAPRIVAWLRELIEQTCSEPPILVAHSLGGSFAARFAIEHGDRIRRVVLVDSGSLDRFRPRLAVILALVRFSARPSPATHDRFLGQVLVDLERTRAGWGGRWGAFEAYHIDRAAQPSVGAANRQLLRRMGVRRIPSDQLGKIDVPVALIWGRNDPVMRFRIAENASRKFGWPLYPIDDCGHVPQGTPCRHRRCVSKTEKPGCSPHSLSEQHVYLKLGHYRPALTMGPGFLMLSPSPRTGPAGRLLDTAARHLCHCRCLLPTLRRYYPSRGCLSDGAAR